MRSIKIGSGFKVQGSGFGSGFRVQGYAELNQVDEKAVAELWFEPCRLGRHRHTRVGGRHQIIQADGIERESHGGCGGVDQPLELACPSRSTDEIDALVRADISDAQNRLEQLILKHADVERLNRVLISGTNQGTQRAPGPVEIHRYVAALHGRSWTRFDPETLTDRGQKIRAR